MKSKTYLMIPLALTLFMAANKISADEQNQSLSASEVISSDATSVSELPATTAQISQEVRNNGQDSTIQLQQTQEQSDPITSTSETTVSSMKAATNGSPAKANETETVPSQASTASSVQTPDQISTVPSVKAETTSTADQLQSTSSAPLGQQTDAKRLSNKMTPASSVQARSSLTQDKQVQAQEVTSAVVEEKGIKLQYNGQIARNTKIQFAVWSARNDQDDLQWYTANNMGAAYAEFKNHREYGTYYVHTYANQNGKMIGLNAATLTIAQPQVQTNIQRKSATNFELTVSNVPNTISSIMVPVWSDQNGQDDIKWYNARKADDGSYKVLIDTKNHKNDLGHYEAHIYGYSTVTQSQIGLAVSSGFDRNDTKPNARISVANYDQNKTTFDVVVEGSSDTKTVSAVNIAVWSEDKGQDDLKWYSPKIVDNKATVTINIANHSNTSDKYNVHVYTDYTDGTHSGTILGAYQINKPLEKNTVSADLTSDGIALKLDSNTVTDYTKVRFAVWSDQNGQDDLKWYSANSDGAATAAYSNHSGYGLYHIHTYIIKDGKMVGLNGRTITINQPSAKVDIAKESDALYKVTVSNLPAYISSVVIPVWTDKNNQDDIQWIPATKQGDGTYAAQIQLADHNGETGHYNVHVYGQSKFDNKTVGLAATDGFNVAETRNAVIAASNYNASAGTIDMIVKQEAGGKAIKEVRIAAWSEADQSNLHWYVSSTIIDGKVIVTINEKNHQYIKGNYNIHVYVDYTDGTSSGTNIGNYSLNADKPAVALPSYFIDISSHNGIISVAEFNSLKQQGIQGVVVKLTEGTSYINPYASSQIANARAAGIKVSAYHYAHYTSAVGAQEEARYFANAARSFGLEASTVMVNDMEESSMVNNINNNVQAWQDEMRRQGYSNLIHYTMASWLDIRGGQVDTARFGINNFWVAHYAKGYTYMTQEEAKSLNYYANAAAWQYTSVSSKLSHTLDENIDYTGRFTQQ